jgi:hypothetical protein
MNTQTLKLRLKASAIAVVGLAFAIFAPILATGVASAQAGTYCSGSGGSCPVFGTSSPPPFTTLGNGAPVGMICWTDNVWYTVNYSSNRWFKGNNPIVGIQWFHSSAIFNQTSVPHC